VHAVAKYRIQQLRGGRRNPMLPKCVYSSRMAETHHRYRLHIPISSGKQRATVMYRHASALRQSDLLESSSKRDQQEASPKLQQVLICVRLGLVDKLKPTWLSMVRRRSSCMQMIAVKLHADAQTLCTNLANDKSLKNIRFWFVIYMILCYCTLKITTKIFSRTLPQYLGGKGRYSYEDTSLG
jgi:hypothetical protein